MKSSRVIGIGTDIVECQRIADMIEKHDAMFLEKVYSPNEIQYCSSRKPPMQHFAGRWAAKEAILKALGTGWAKGVHWKDIEIVNDEGGKPIVHLHAGASAIAQQCGIAQVLISISHCQAYAVAFATAVGGDH
jgi:holo-[acyl-carrier protein] synthase